MGRREAMDGEKGRTGNRAGSSDRSSSGKRVGGKGQVCKAIRGPLPGINAKIVDVRANKVAVTNRLKSCLLCQHPFLCKREESKRQFRGIFCETECSCFGDLLL